MTFPTIIRSISDAFNNEAESIEKSLRDIAERSRENIKSDEKIADRYLDDYRSILERADALLTSSYHELQARETPDMPRPKRAELRRDLKKIKTAARNILRQRLLHTTEKSRIKYHMTSRRSTTPVGEALLPCDHALNGHLDFDNDHLQAWGNVRLTQQAGCLSSFLLEVDDLHLNEQPGGKLTKM
ncbi:hypothetical protein LTR84_007688 [Exophiala bonariae]|uniref:Uncharacterized protein n=1 Tax=Exophiala bonariae TaxID=1690606 RepID=A0AAV9NKS1_9EURO|nr:hypothetical protein LTR84_007688 [Exophiala bonariae]